MSPRVRRLRAMLEELLQTLAAEERPAPGRSATAPRHQGLDHEYYLTATYQPCCEAHEGRGVRRDEAVTDHLAGPARRYVRERLGWRR